MRALTLKAPGQLVWQDVPEPEGDGVLVAIRRVGICGTDLHAYAGRQPGFSYPVRLGHELAVDMLEASPGTLCAVNPYFHCDQCVACRSGKTNCCESLSVLGVHQDGGLTQRLRVPDTHLIASSVLPVEQLALVEPLVVAYHAVRRAGIGKGDTVLVVGLGPIGLGVAMCARQAGATLICTDLRRDRRLAAQQMTSLVLDGREVCEKSLRAAFKGDLPGIVIDATGSADSMHQSYHWVAPGGKLVFVGLFEGDFAFEDLDFHRRELTLLASRNGTGQDFRAVIRLMESGELDPSWMITHRLTMDELPDRFASLSGMESCIKAMVSTDQV